MRFQKICKDFLFKTKLKLRRKLLKVSGEEKRDFGGKRPKIFQTALVSVSLAGLILLYLFLSYESPYTLPDSIGIYSTDLDHNLERLYLQALDEAKERIDLTIYSFNDMKLIEKLNQKAKEGLFVRVVYDPKASPKLLHQLSDHVEKIPRFSRGLTHIKMLVIDQRVTYIGSANFTPASLTEYGNIVVGIDEESVGEFCSVKIADLERRDERFAHEEFGEDLEVWFTPDDPLAAKRIVDLIRSAEKSIQVGMFAFTRMDFAKELVQAKRRGVEVVVTLDQKSAKGMGKKVVQFLRENEVKTQLTGGDSLFHYKMALIDDQTLIEGSLNWTKAAFTKNDDCFIILKRLDLDQQIQVKNLVSTWQLR